MPKDLFVSGLLDVYGVFLSEKQRNLAEFYYNDDLSLSEIAENEGITRQGVCDIIKRAEAQLRAFEKECKYCEKFSKLKGLSKEIRKGNNEDISQILDIIEEL